MSKFLEVALVVWDEFCSPAALDLRAGIAAMIGAVIVAEMILAMF